MKSNRYVLLAAALLIVGGANATEGLNFQDTDENGDGFISKLEIKSAPQNEANWAKADSNNDGKLDASEFSAFESMMTDSPSEAESSGTVSDEKAAK